MPTALSVRARAFTLAELVGVLTVLAVLSATAIPAVRMIGDTGSAEVALRLEDSLRHARATAVGLGVPCGVRIDKTAQTVSLLMLEGTTAAPMQAAMGDSVTATPLDPRMVVGVKSVTGGSTAGNSPEIWFDQTGSHAKVTGAGVVSILARDATVVLTSGKKIIVRGTTGMIE